MSSILDALQKSERARAQQQRSFGLKYGESAVENRFDANAHLLPTAPVSPPLSAPWLLLGLFIGIVLVLLAVIALLLWQPRSPAAASPAPSTPAVVMVPWSTPAVVPELATPLKVAPATVAPANDPKTALDIPFPAENFPEEMTTLPLATPPVAERPASASDLGEVFPPAGKRSQSLPTLGELPAFLRQQLPALEIDIHAYDPLPEKRFVFINLVRYNQGDYLNPEILLQEITREGVILRFQQVAFRVLLQE